MDDAQARAAAASRDRFETTARRPVLTEIAPLGKFHLAEDYHQKYRLRSDAELYRDFRGMYPTAAGLLTSTAAARVNAYLGGEGTAARLRDEIGSLGLSDNGTMRLMMLVEGRSLGKL